MYFPMKVQMIHCKISFLLVLLFLLLLGGVSAQAQQSKPTGGGTPDRETAKIIRELAADAAGMPDVEFRKLANSGMTPDRNSENQPLTLMLMCYTHFELSEKDFKDRLAEFRFSSLTPNMNKLVKLLEPSDAGDRWTALHSKHITKVTCNVDNNIATGVISFDAGMYAGLVHYTASKLADRWKIDEFSFPVHDWRFVDGDDGNWQWFDHFGRIEKDRVLPMQHIEGQVLLDDKPIQVRQLVFTLKAHPEYAFFAKTGRSGKFGVSLPTGQYIVTCKGDDLSDRFNDLSQSGLIVVVEKGQSEMTLDLKLTPQDQPEVTAKTEVQAKRLVAALQKKMASGDQGRHFLRDVEELVSMNVPESSRVAATGILKSILNTKYKTVSKPSSLHQLALDGLLSWASVEDQNSIFCDYLSSRSNRAGDQAEKVFGVLIDAGSERGLRLVIRRLSRFKDAEENPAAQALIKGGTKCETPLLAAAESSKSIRKSCFGVLEKIGSEKSIPILEKLEQETENVDDRNKIREARMKILDGLGKATSK